MLRELINIPSKREYELYSMICHHNILNYEDLLDIEIFLKKLIASNRVSHTYSDVAFTYEIYEHWHSICLNMSTHGVEIFKDFYNSRLYNEKSFLKNNSLKILIKGLFYEFMKFLYR